MFRNYLVIAWRNLLRHKIFTFINILGLALGMAACLLILQYVSFEKSYDQFHEKRDRIFRVSLTSIRSDQTIEDACAHNLAGPTLVAEFPEVIDEVHFRLRDKAGITYRNTHYRESKVALATENFFSLFSFPLLKGDPASVLAKPNTVVLSESTARKYFGTADPIGKVLGFNDGYHQLSLQVSGIMKNMPANSHFHLDLLISYASSKDWESWKYGWSGNNDFVYVLLAPNANAASLAAKMPAFNQKYLHKDNRIDHLVMQSLNDIHLYSNKTYEAESNGSAQLVYSLLGIGILLLVVAWVNYINLSTARSAERAKEVGIRKVMGSQRGQLMRQFLLEALMINTFAILLAVTIAQVTGPLFDGLTGKPLSQYALPFPLWAAWIGLFLLGSGLAGLYPAFALSGFKPIAVLKGKFVHSRKGIALRRGLVVGQFATTVVLIAVTLTIYRQLDYMQNRDLGMKPEQVLVLQAPQLPNADSSKSLLFKRFGQQVALSSAFRHVSFTECLPGNGFYELNTNSGDIKRVNNPDPYPRQYAYFAVDEEFVPALGLKLLAGKGYLPKEAGNNKNKILINDAARHQLGFRSASEAAGQLIKFGDATLSIAGVIANYHHHSLDKNYDPMVFYYDGNYENTSYISLKINGATRSRQQMAASIAAAENLWKEVFPGYPFDYFFLDDQFNSQYKADQQFGQVFTLFAALTIFVACLGLFGLVAFTTTQRIKEIGVRKVLGASEPTILVLLSKDFLKPILLANIIAWPLAWWGISTWLDNYAFRIGINAWLFIIPAVMVLLIAFITISLQTINAAKTNPVNVLRAE
jgi:putative ABC transport system permease protein